VRQSQGTSNVILTALSRAHPETIDSVANLGVNYKDPGRLKEAIPLPEEAHRAARKYPDLAWVFPPLLDAYTRAGANTKIATLVTISTAQVVSWPEAATS
jgi:hypothetical protein